MNTTRNTRNSRGPGRSTKRRTRLNMVEANNAIYIDFENIPYEQPTLLGVAWSGTWNISILDEQLAEAANWEVDGGSIKFRSADTTLELIRTFAEDTNRRVCAWSGHDLRMIKRIYADQPQKVQWWESNLVNIRGQATSFVRFNKFPTNPIVSNRTGQSSIGHQSVIMDALGINVPEKYGRGVAARGIKALRDALAENPSLDAVGAEVKEQWMATLLHNRYDCFGMAAIMCPVTRGRGHTLLHSKWVMDPHQPAPLQGELEEVVHENPPALLRTFEAAWADYDFFYGATYSNQGWCIAEFRNLTRGSQAIIPIETAMDLQTACNRAEVENLAMNLRPSFDWRAEQRWA